MTPPRTTPEERALDLLSASLDISMPVVISYSGGTSSEWMIHAMLRGILPRHKNTAVVFADTGAEHDWTYPRVDFVERVCLDAGLDFLRCKHPKYTLTEHVLSVADGITRADHPPFFIKKDSGGRGRAAHRCTREFKVAPMRRAVSAWLQRKGLRKRDGVERWVGFGFDEIGRAQKALAKVDVAWERLEFPAVVMGRTREQQRADVVSWTGSAPPFSMCVFCPWKTPERWAATSKKDLETAFAADEALRDPTALGLTAGEGYLSDRLIPVRELLLRGDAHPDRALERDGSYCDAGACFL